MIVLKERMCRELLYQILIMTPEHTDCALFMTIILFKKNSADLFLTYFQLFFNQLNFYLT